MSNPLYEHFGGQQNNNRFSNFMNDFQRLQQTVKNPKQEVAQAIEECLQEPVTGNKRAVLADLIIIQDYLFGEPMQAQEAPQPMPMQSYSAPPMEQAETYIQTNGDSEFLKAVDGRKADKVWKLIDELVEAVKILHPRMYTTFIDTVPDL